MKQILWLLLLLSSVAHAEMVDAFQGVLPVTDPAMKKSLNGEWSLKVVNGITDDKSVPLCDDSWGIIPVPGCWEAYGFCKPKYDSPNPLTGYYRTTFAVPNEWRGQRIVIRFDGVLYGYDLWINGKQAGSWRSGYNTALFDITDYLTKGEQQLAMRVISQFPGSDFDYNDDWAPNGIFRDVTLMAVPKTHLSDLTIHTKNTGEVSVDTKIANANKQTVVSHEILDAQDNVVGTSKVSNPKLWTAETPYLYTLRTTLSQKGKTLQHFEHKFGFRELTIDGTVIKLNGQPIKFRGVTSHATDPKTVKVINEELTLKDMRLMKEASVNYIRTSHYPREPRFYELADSLGFYIIDEVPFGYGDKNLEKEEFYPVLQQRAQATIRRDKNHPSVLIWSLGNENPLTDICIKLGDHVKAELDPSRPICYPQIGSYFRKFNYNFPKVADIYTPHYPTTSQVGDFYQRADRPVIFTEYLHTLGISFEDHDRQWEIIERTPCIAGGSVWEWVDQGMPFKGKKVKGSKGKKMYGYEEKVYTSESGGFEMNGNKGTDGLLYADRTPLPNYYELQHNYAQVAVIDTVFTGTLHIRNRYDFIDLKDNVTLHWSLTDGQQILAQGDFSPACAPHQTVEYPLSLSELPTDRLLLLNIDIKNRQGWTLLRQSLKLQDAPAIVSTAKASVQEMIQQGPMVRVGRKETMGERIKVKGSRIARYLQPLQNPYVKAEVSQDGDKVNYTLTPDTARYFLSEMGVAYLLDKRIDRVQWLGYGPYASYPGRQKANRYGVWALQQDDLYFEGNRMGVDAAWFSDKDGNGILITGKNLNVNFEQTDLGIVVTVNAAVSGQGPKFAQTAFGVWSNEIGTQEGTFQMMRTEAEQQLSPFSAPADIPAPFKPFRTQYDTYLMKYDAIFGNRELPTREQVGPSVMPETIAPISAPFEMPQLQRPDIPARKTTVKLNRNSMNTKAIQAAINEMARQGGGTVEIPAGEWQTGRIEVKSNVNLHLAEGATLYFSGQIKDYLPVVFTRDEGIEIYSLGAFIYAHDAENIAITGKGRIVGPSIDCEIYQKNKAKALNIEKTCLNGEMPLEDRVFDGIKNHGEVFLPKTIAPINCKNVLIEGITLDQGLYWNVVPQYCEDVIIRGVTVNSFGHGRTDGIDVESSKNVLIEYCSLDCQDDCYTMKSGRGVDGLRVNRPTENVVVRHSLALRGAGGIVCGTEVAGFVKNVYCHDCVFDGTDQAFRVKSRRTRGGGIENYFVERVRANVKYQAFYCDLLGEPKWMGELAQRFPMPKRTRLTPYFHDISVHDVIIENCRDFISYTGQPELPVKNVLFGNATVKCQRIGHVQDVSGFALKDVEINSEDSVLTLDGCSVVNIFGVNNLQLKAPVKVIQKGKPSKYVSVQEVPLQPITYHSIRSGTVWLDTDGKPIQAHGFQITYADGSYYWYGENKADALLGTNQMFGGVRCYSSRDFYNWKDEGLILPPDTVNPLSPIHYSQKLERPHIIRNPRNGKYVLWAKSQAEDGYFAIFEADRFMGPYTFVRNLQPEGYGVGDFDMYVDEQTGKGYVWFERPHWELICAELTDDFLDVTDVYSNHFVGQKPPFTREAPAHFVANGKHYLYTSGTTGYTSNPTEVAVFDDYHGEYRILGDPHVGDSCASSFNSQITGVIKIPGQDMWIALADRWEPHTTNTDFSRKTVEAKKDAYANYKPQPQKPVGTVPQVVDRRYKLVDMAHAVYHAGYVFLPITFEDGIPRIHWQDEWDIK